MNVNKMNTNSDSSSSLEHLTEENTVDPLEPGKLLATISHHSNKGTTQKKLSLFAAVEEEDLEMLLLRSDVNLNKQNRCGETALRRGIRLERSFAFISRLIDSSCDVNIFDSEGRTALHVAISKGAIDVAYKLIGAGADLNAYDAKKGTPLHYAVFHNNLECVCMLLSCGADVRLPSISITDTPLTLAFLTENVEVIKTLLYYYYEFSNACLKSVFIDVTNVSRVVEDILLIEIALLNGYVEAFRLIWSRFDHKTLLFECEWFLFEYVRKDVFPASSWLDCLYLILESPYALDLIEQYSSYGGDYFLITALDILSENKENRIALIYMCLSVGITVDLCEFEWIYNTVGFNEELEALIYAGNYAWADRPGQNNLLLHFVLSLREDCSPEKIFDYLYRKVWVWCKDDSNIIIQWLKFFSLRSHMISELVDAYCLVSSEDESEISARLCHAPELPSLLELSRNQVQKCIRRTHRITKPYQFHDVVKGLPLPKTLKDVVLFKRPIYKF